MFISLEKDKDYICSSLKEFKDEGIFADVTFACEGKFISAHKIVISTSSIVFKNILQQNPHSNPLIYLLGVKYAVLVNLLELIYFGQVEIQQEHVDDFVTLFGEFQLEGTIGDYKKDYKKDGNNQVSNIINEFDGIVENYAFSEDTKNDIELFGKKANLSSNIKIEERSIKNTWMETSRVKLISTKVKQEVGNDGTDQQDTINKENSEIKELHTKIKMSADDSTVRKVDVIVPQNKSEDFLKVNCHDCNERFPNNNVRNEHVKSVHNRILKCTLCSEIITGHSELIQHKINMHKYTFDCKFDKCEKSFKQERDLQKHSIDHSVQYEHMCEKCTYRCKRKKELYVHYDNKHPEIRNNGLLLCEYCDKVFNIRSKLKYHLDRKHNLGVKKFKCGFCDHKFWQNQTLIEHERTHTEEKPFECSYCGQKFRAKKTWTNHTRLHTGVKPYSCNSCNKAFAQRTSLKVHKCTV